jgi:ferric-dicitrate binding protein FerR (iron transport regulator)
MTEQKIEELIQKYSSGTAREDEIKKLMDWYRDSTGEVGWPSSDPMEKKKVHDRMLSRMQNEIRGRQTPVISFSWSKVAAILVLILGVTAVLVYYKPFSPAYLTVNNPPGKIQTIQLPDGSHVSLNANSSLRYAKDFEENRTLELTGEGYFDVTHDPSHPFTVKAGELETTVVGTSFNIKAYTALANTTVSVITGRVKVTHEDRDLGLLSPSKQLTFDKANQTANTANIDTSSITSWTKGKLQFEGERFSDIAAALENWYGVKIILTNPGIGLCRYYMTFDNTMELEKLLGMMSSITEMQYSVDKNSNTITFTGKECR